MRVANISVRGTVSRRQLAEQLATTLELGLSVPVFMATLLCDEAHKEDAFVVGWNDSFDVNEFSAYRETVRNALGCSARHQQVPTMLRLLALEGITVLLDSISDEIARVVDENDL